MKKQLLPYAITVAVAAVMSGCGMIEKNPIYGEEGIFKDRNQEYEKATVSQKLEIPNQIQAKPTQDQLVIPRVGQTASVRTTDFEVPRPEFFYADTGSDTVKFKKLGDQKVIVVDEPIADVWEKAIDFMKFNQVPVATTDARTGVIESDWILTEGPELTFLDRWMKRLTLQDLPDGTRNKIKVSLKPDPENYQRTSIQMQHVQYPKAQAVDAVNWDTEAREVAYKSDMMFEMLRYMSKATVKPTERSLLAMQNARAARPLLGRDSRGKPVLKIESRIDQAWALLNTAVDNAHLDVGTRNQEIGIMYMTYTTSIPVETKKDQGFFAWLFSDRGEIKLNTDTLNSILGGKTQETISYSAKSSAAAPLAEGESLALSDPNNPANRKGYKIWFAGKVIYVFGSEADQGGFNAETNAYEHTGKYQLKMNRTRSGVFVSVLNDQGLAAPDTVSDEILWAIKDNMPVK